MKKFGLKLIAASLMISSAMLAHAAPYKAVQQDKSTVTFAYQQMGVKVDGRFKQFKADLQLDPAQPQQGKASMSIDLTSIDAGSSDANQEVKGKAWFNVAEFPKATFVSKSIKALAADQFEVQGTLSIKGQNREIKFNMTHAKQGVAGVFKGSFVIKRADFNIGDGMWAKFDIVANEIPVQFMITAQ